MSFIFFSLTPEEDEKSYNVEQEQETNWLDDSECQENLFNIIPLTPEESTVDKDNHIQTSIKLFFQELGYLTEEPEPIDPNRDYEAEAKLLLDERNKKTRKQHINIPSLDHSHSGISSSSSSIHHDHHIDIRSPHFLGSLQSNPNYHCKVENITYHYGNYHHHHQYRPSKLH